MRTSSLRNRRSLWIGLLWAGLGLSPACTRPSASALRAPVPLSASDAILDLFTHVQVVGLADLHGNQQLWDFIDTLVRDRRFARTVHDVTFECGNVRHQDVVDRYVAGADVPVEQLRAVWRDNTQANTTCDAPVYARLLATVRSVNASLPADRRLRVILLDPPIDWATIRSAAEWEAAADREPHMVDVLEREVYAKERRALFIAGGAHLTRGTSPHTPGTPLSTLERRHPGTTFAIGIHEAGDPPDIAAAHSLDRWPVPSFARLEGTWLARLVAPQEDFFVGPDGEPVQGAASPLGTQYDGIVYIGTRASWTRSDAAPIACADQQWIQELERRARIIGGPPLDRGTTCAAQPAAWDQPTARPRAPEIFAPGIISTGDAFSLALTPDGRRAVFTRSSADRTRMALYYADSDGTTWSPARLVPFSGRYRDLDPFISPDGRTLYFNSFRPVTGSAERADTEIWSVALVGDGWGEPVHLGPAIHSASADDFPSVTSDGVLYFGSTRPGGAGGVDIYRAWSGPAGYGAAENVAALNSAAHESNPFVSPNGRVLLMASTRAGEAARTDLWVSVKRQGRWSPPRRLGAHINTSDSEFCPVISPDGRRLFFSRIRWDGTVRLDEAIYHVPIEDALSADELVALRDPPRSDDVGKHADTLDYLGQAPPGLTPTPFSYGRLVPVGSRPRIPVFSRDGRMLVFNMGDTSQIYISVKGADGWSAPSLAPFSDAGSNWEPHLMADDATLLFVSTRPPGRPPHEGRIWRTRLGSDGAWAAPTLAVTVDDREGLWFPTGHDLSAVYFSGTLAGTLGDSDLWRVDLSGGESRLVNLGAPLNSTGIEWDPVVSPDGTYLLFVSNRPGGQGRVDIYASFHAGDGAWSEPVNLGPAVNTARNEVAATVSPDGRYLFFIREPGELFWVSADIVERARGR